MDAVKARSVRAFIDRLHAILWPDTDDSGLARWQVNAMHLEVTDSGGRNRIVTLDLVPGVNGLQVKWEDD